MKIVRRRLLHILIAFDQFAFSLITLGGSYPDETISAACWRLESEGKLVGKIFRPLIDLLFLPIERNHCYESYLAEVERRQLPPEYQV